MSAQMNRLSEEPISQNNANMEPTAKAGGGAILGLGPSAGRRFD